MLNRFASRLRRDERGASLVEFALVSPLLFLLLVGIIEVGRYAAFSIAVANAARAGAEYAAQMAQTSVDIAGTTAAASADDDQKTANFNVTASSYACTGPTTTPPCPSTANANRSITMVQVTVTDTESSLFSYPGIPATHAVTSTAYMQVLDLQ